MATFSSGRQWVKKELGLTGRDARRIERALCTLADFEGEIVTSFGEGGNFQHALANVCHALRKIADAWEFDEAP